MKKIIIMLIMCIIPNVSMANDIDIVTRYSVSSTVSRILLNLISEMNRTQSTYNFKFSHIPGAGGEIADQTALQYARSNKDVIIFSPTSSFTFNKILIGDTYDRDNDFIRFFAVSGAPLAIQVNPKNNIKNISDLVRTLKEKENSYFASTLSSGSLMMFNKIFLNKYNLNKVKDLKYKVPSDIFRSVLINEADYTIFNISDINMKPILVSSDLRLKEFPDVPTGKEIGFNDFSFTSLNMFSVPKEKKNLIAIVLPLIKNACSNDEVQMNIEKMRYIPYCTDDRNFIQEKINKELELIKKYKHFIEIAK